MMSEYKYRLAIAKTEDGVGIGIERIKAGSGDIDDVNYIASIYVDERLSNREIMIRAVNEVLAIAGDEESVSIRVSAGNNVFAKWSLRNVNKQFPNVKLFKTENFIRSATKLAEDAIKRKTTITENLK